MPIIHRFRRRAARALFLASALPLLTAWAWLSTAPAFGLTHTWNGTTGDWSDGAKWTNDVPAAGGDVVIAAGSVTLSAASADLGSFTMTGGTLTFTNSAATLKATNAWITGGTVRHAANSDTSAAGGWTVDGRVYFLCTNFFLGSAAVIDANARGWGAPAANSAGYGPGAGASGRAGGAYGGFGGNYAKTGGMPYGSLTSPDQPGSGGGGWNASTPGGAGGGLVIVESHGGSVVVNGTIRANGGSTGASNAGGGSGGGIWISCGTLTGTNGTIQANGGDASNGGPGGGGRIAVTYDTALQAGAPATTVTFSARRGTGGGYVADLGTLYFPDNAFLSTSVPHSGQWMVPGFTSWAPASLTVTNGWIRFPAPGMQIAVTGRVEITGASAGLELGGNGFLSNGLYREGIYFNYGNYSDMSEGLSLRVGGDLVLTNGGFLRVYSPPTNTAAYGALVSVTGDVVVASTSAIYPVSDPTNGGSVCFLASNVTVLTGGSINANEAGYGPGRTSGANPGFGPGAGGSRGGAAYGGVGGNFANVAGRPYGNASAPKQPGSGGGNADGVNVGSAGGGLVWIEATNRIAVHGTITANPATPAGNAGVGSGGGVYLKARTFAASGGTLRANGLTAPGTAGSGGGGRIAIDYDPAAQALAGPVTVTLLASGGAASYPSDIGTVWLPDTQLLKESLDFIEGQILGVSAWGPTNLTVTGRRVKFGEDGFALAVTNDLKVDGAAALLELGGGRIWDAGSFWQLPNGQFVQLIQYNGGVASIDCGGSLVLTNGGDLRVFCGPTNAGAAWGGLVSVTGSVSLGAGSWVYPVTEPTNGGSARFRMGRLSVAASSGFDATQVGFAGGGGSRQTGFGYGAGGYQCGGGYGGAGGGTSGGGTYGASNAPAESGSGGGRGNATTYTYSGGSGGGLVRIEAAETVTLDGTLKATGRPSGTAGGSAAGSGGGVYVLCRTLAGAGTLQAKGGDGIAGGASGGGGRIAVSRAYDTFGGAYNVDPGATGNLGKTGTVVRIDRGPNVTNLYATNVTASAADLVGELVSTGTAPSQVYCFWGESDGLADASAWDTNDLLGVLAPGVLTNHLTSLTGATLFYFRFLATNENGGYWASPSLTFSTVGGAAVNNGAGATNVTTVSATLRGVVTSGNPTPQTYVCWGDDDPGVASTGAWDRVESLGLQLSAFSVDITNLLANRTYHYRCYVTNTTGEGWAAAPTNFTTLSPDLWIDDATAVVEGDAGSANLVFPVRLSATSAIPVSVAFQSADGLATVAGSDYGATNGTLTLPAGEVSGTIRVTVAGDTADEYPYEDLYVNLSIPSGVVIADSQGYGRIDDDDDVNQSKVWNGVGPWTSFTNWTPIGRPGPADDVVINSGTATLSEAVSIQALWVTNAARLVFSNWTAKLTASDVTLTNGVITLPSAFTSAQPSNRVWLVCSNLAMASGSRIDADARGYAASPANPPYGYGPGAPIGIRSGAGHGGVGGNFNWDNGWPYGSAGEPQAPGSSSDGSAGGGAIRLDVAGAVTLNGTITASGENTVGGNLGCGAGGSVWLSCRTLEGSGLVRADGGTPVGTAGGGGGGRIAVAYDGPAQAALPVPAVRFSVRGGTPAGAYAGEHGTLSFPDSYFLTPTVSRLYGEMVGLGEWSVTNLVVSNTLLHFPQPGFRLSVSNDLTVTAGGRLLVGGDALRRNSGIVQEYGPFFRYTDSTSAPQVVVSGSVVVTNASELHVFAAATNGSDAPWGALVDAGGDFRVYASSWLVAASHPTNGASPLLRARNVRVAALGGISASTRGFAGVPMGAASFGPGAGGSRSGASHGGVGNYTSPGSTYGSSNAPVLAGSGGGSGLAGGSGGCGGGGGGVVRIEASGAVTVDGTLASDARAGGGTHSGGGSGGSILVDCVTFSGAGRLTAVGGAGGSTSAGGGGGGRIAVWYGGVSPEHKARLLAGQEAQIRGLVAGPTYPEFTGTIALAGGEAGTYDGTPGTVVFLTVPPPAGTVFMLR